MTANFTTQFFFEVISAEDNNDFLENFKLIVKVYFFYISWYEPLSSS